MDEQVARTTEAGLFPLVGILTLPAWMPDDWLALPRGGDRERWRQRRPDPWDSKFLSLWNAEAQAYHRGLLRVLIDRYGEQALVIQHNAFGDESPLPPAPTPHLFDAEAVKDHVAKFGCEPEIATAQTQRWMMEAVVNHAVATQRVLAGQRNEIWTAINRAYAVCLQSNGAQFQEEVWRALRSEFPGAVIYSAQHRWFGLSTSHHDWMLALAKELGIEMFVGGQYGDGLPESAPRAIADGVRIVVAPINLYRGYTGVSMQVVGNYRNAYKSMQKARSSAATIETNE